MKADLLAELRAIVGDRNVLAPPDDLSSWNEGARNASGHARAVVRPKTTQEVSACMKVCAVNNVDVVPQAGNTGLVGGSTPDDTDTQVVLSIARLDGPFDLDIENRSLTVGAGRSLSDVNRQLEEHGYTFPIDLGADPRIGGMVATNTGGARFLKYGDVRANTLGLTVVLPGAGGMTVTFGNALHKDNSDIDWKHLFIGSWGSFGVITEVILKVHPLLLQRAAALLVPTSRRALGRLLTRLEAAFGSDLSAFEGMSGNAIRHALSHVPGLRKPFGQQIPDYAILVEVSRTSPLRQGEPGLEIHLQDVLGETIEDEPELLLDAKFGAIEPMWTLRHALSEGLRQAGKIIAFDLSFRRGDVARFWELMTSELGRRHPDAEVCDFGHIGDGGVHYNVVAPTGSALAEDPALQSKMTDFIVATAVETFGGSFSAEHGVGGNNRFYYERYMGSASQSFRKNWTTILNLGPT